MNNQQTPEDDDEVNILNHKLFFIYFFLKLLRYLPKSERYKEIKHVHIDSMFGESGKLQLLKNATEEREAMAAQAAIHVPKGETRKRAQITYLIAKVNKKSFYYIYLIFVCFIF
jgi:hypothetical protein